MQYTVTLLFLVSTTTLLPVLHKSEGTLDFRQEISVKELFSRHPLLLCLLTLQWLSSTESCV